MVLVTPTGSGKTTTLYAAVSENPNEEDKIITIEDPSSTDSRHYADSGQRKKRADLRRGLPLHPAPRS